MVEPLEPLDRTIACVVKNEFGPKESPAPLLGVLDVWGCVELCDDDEDDTSVVGDRADDDPSKAEPCVEAEYPAFDEEADVLRWTAGNGAGVWNNPPNRDDDAPNKSPGGKRASSGSSISRVESFADGAWAGRFAFHFVNQNRRESRVDMNRYLDRKDTMKIDDIQKIPDPGIFATCSAAESGSTFWEFTSYE